MGKLRIWATIGFVFFVSASARAGHVILFVNTLAGDSIEGNADDFEGLQYERLQHQFQNSNFISIRTRSNSDLQHQLSHIVNSSTVVDALVVESHGDSDGGQGWYEATVSDYDGVFPDGERGKFQVNLVSDTMVRRTFSQVIGKFAKGAKIIFNGCDLLAAGSENEKMRAIARVADNFGLSVGEVYMSKTSGENMRDVIIGQPFQDEPDEKSAAWHLVNQALWFLSYPEMLVIEQIEDRGYTLIRDEEKDGVSHDRVYKDNYFNAEKSAQPTGALVSGDAK